MVMSEREKWTFDVGSQEGVIAAIEEAANRQRVLSEQEVVSLELTRSYRHLSSGVRSLGTGTMNIVGLLSQGQNLSEDQRRTLAAMRTAMVVNNTVTTIYSAAIAAKKALTAKEVAAASAETAAFAAAQQWPQIGAATAASAFVLGTFGAGFVLGVESRKADLSTPEGRLHAAEHIGQMKGAIPGGS